MRLCVVAWTGLIGLASLMAGCAGFSWPGQGRAAVASLPGQIEAVHSAAIAQDQAVFWVSSNGCTAKADLTPVVRQDGAASVITLRRVRQDPCRDPQPQGVEMRWTFQELGLASGTRVRVENPYQITPARP